MRWRLRGTIILTLGLASYASSTWAQSAYQVVTDRLAYNAGQPVRIRVVRTGTASGRVSPADSGLTVSIFYQGDPRPAAANLRLAATSFSGRGDPEFAQIWTVPPDAPTGRYLIRASGRTPDDRLSGNDAPPAASFGVYRKLVDIEQIKLNGTFFTSGDPVGAEVILRNLTSRPLAGLRVEFSDRYWPWIAGPAEQARASIVSLADSVSIAAGESRLFRVARVAIAPEVKKPSVHQYGVIAWNRERTQMLAVAFSALVFVHPPNLNAPRPYPGQYMYPELAGINDFSYRHFDASEPDSGAIAFEHAHTIWPPGSTAAVGFRLRNPTPFAWRGVQVIARLLGPTGKERATRVIDSRLELPAGGPSMARQAAFAIAPGDTGVCRLVVEVRSPGGSVLAADEIELGVDVLPKSILIFCAHEDDEGSFDGLVRAAIENRIPVRLAYFTSGDAGSCDRYYQHSCSPEEALNFGAIRMQEAVTAMGHLGLSPEEIAFFGLPDGGSGAIWYDHRTPQDPFLDPLLAADHSPYDEIFGTNLSYDRRSVVEAVKALITKYQPDMVCTPHPPAVGHIDHIVDNFLVVQALRELAEAKTVPPDLEVLSSRVYDPKTQPPTPYRYRSTTFFVSGDVAALVQEAQWFHQSQGGTMAEGRLKNFRQLPRSEEFRQMLDWKEHAGWNEAR